MRTPTYGMGYVGPAGTKTQTENNQTVETTAGRVHITLQIEITLRGLAGEERVV